MLHLIVAGGVVDRHHPRGLALLTTPHRKPSRN
jgi:hypothetical protein